MRIKYELNSIRLGVFFSLSLEVSVFMSSLVNWSLGAAAPTQTMTCSCIGFLLSEEIDINLRVNKRNGVMNGGERGGGA